MESVSAEQRHPEKRREILRVSLLLLIITIASKFLAYIVQAKKASYFGIGPVVDCFEWALFFPTLIYSFAFNVLNVLLVPIFGGRESSESLDRAYHALVTWCLVGFAALSVLLFALAPELVALFSNFDDESRRALAVTFLRILAASILFIGIEGVQSGFLLAEKRAVSVAGVRLFKEVIFVAVMVFGFAWFAGRVLPIGWLTSAAIGGVAFFALGWRRHRFAFRIVHVDDYILRLLRNLWPVLILFVLINVNDLVRVKLLSGRPNDLSTFRYAYYLFLLPHVLIAENLILFLFPLMAAEANQGDMGRLRHSIRSGVKLLLFFILPASVGLIVLARPVIELLYERHAFEKKDTLATMLPLIYLSLGMWAFSLHVLFARTLDALQAYWRRVVVESIFAVVGISLSWWWIHAYGFNGAAWALTVSITLLLVLEIRQINQLVGGVRMRIIGWDLAKIGLATGIMAGAVAGVFALSERWMTAETVYAQASRLGLAFVAGVVVYFGCSMGLRIIRGEDLGQLRDFALLRKTKTD